MPVLTPDPDEPSYTAWRGRKRVKLRRDLLDCGCPNKGVVSYHLFCDRLACELHADDPHDCSAYAGVKNGTEEMPESAEAVALEAWTAAMSDWLTPETVAAAVDRHVCRGCREVTLVLPGAKLCGPCGELPKCSAERSNARTGRRMVCFRPSGHDTVHEDYDTGSQWVETGPAWVDETHVFEQAELNEHVEALRPERVAELFGVPRELLADAPDVEPGGYRACMERLAPPVEARRPFLTAALDGEADALVARVSAALDELLEPAPVPRRPWWKRWTR